MRCGPSRRCLAAGDAQDCHNDTGSSDASAEAEARGGQSRPTRCVPLRSQLSRDSRRDVVAAHRVIGTQLSQSVGVDPALSRTPMLRLYEAAVAPDQDSWPMENDEKGYFAARAGLSAVEKAIGFDATCRARATAVEERANRLLRGLRRRDETDIYGAARTRTGFASQRHRAFAGDRFLSSIDLIDRSALLDVARKMPKGAHLHVHFNACLKPSVLLNLAKGMDRMFITNDLPLVSDDEYLNFDRGELQFSILSADKEQPGNLFAVDYQPRQTMRFSNFLRQFPSHYPHSDADMWLEKKLVFTPDEACGIFQTVEGAWEKFNGKTRMMKGLFNYESAYRKYTRLFVEDLIKENILYAEIRPNFMRSNQLFREDGSGPIDNESIMRIIDVVSDFQAELAAQRYFFGGLKVIYCTPRVFEPEHVEASLNECLTFKKRWPEWIAGADPSRTLSVSCSTSRGDAGASMLTIPFLFHCGETLEVGTDTDDNLVDALLLGAKRIGHGYALTRRPHMMRMMKARDVCLELCPISNEILGLTPRIGGHAMYELLANNVHCTVNSDNGTMFQSTLSHDFYQAMVGKADMDLFGWRQLVLWSMEHACLDDSAKDTLMRQWEEQWDAFLQWIVAEYGNVLER